MKIHLVSMPSTAPSYTPIQTGCLKAYIDQVFRDNEHIKTFTYSAHLSIPLRAFKSDFIARYDMFKCNSGELLWFTILMRRFNVAAKYGATLSPRELAHRIDKLAKTNCALDTINKLERAAVDFIEEDLVPSLSKTDLNIVGFTITIDQLYSSLFCYFWLLKYYPHYKIVFAFGGGPVCFPQTLMVLKKLKVKGLAVIGEGEPKLEHIVRTCLDGIEDEADIIIKKCAGDAYGIYNIGELAESGPLHIKPQKNMQLKSIEDLPLPDYTEYFDVLRKYCLTTEIYLRVKNSIVLLLNGSRGCSWGRCAFCGVSCFWLGFRTKSARKMHALLSDALVNYKPSCCIQCTDVSCDSWWSEFCDLLLESHQTARLFSQFRAVHDEDFYTKGYLVGGREVQIGVESFSETLLKKMNKGVELIDNIQTLKYLRELDIVNFSNLIIQHPFSTMREVRQTKTMCKLLSHLGKLDIATFFLDVHSPIYDDLSESEIARLRKVNKVKMPMGLLSFFADGLLMPASRDLPPGVKGAWNAFQKWYESYDSSDSYLNVFRLSRNTILVKDNRFQRLEEHTYSGDEAKIYSLCHRAITDEEVGKEMNMDLPNVRRILNRFLKKRLMVLSNNRYLSIALRPREELINNYYERRISASSHM